MKLALGTLVLCCASCATPGSSAPAPERAADREAIHSILHDWNAGWEHHDARLATSGYADDADFTNAFGFHRVGQAAIEAYLAEVFTFDFVMAGVSVDDSVELRFVDDDVALVRTRRTRTGQQMPDGRTLPPRDITHLRAFVRREGTWSIVSHLISDARSTERPEH